jgi:hypothetical protein
VLAQIDAAFRIETKPAEAAPELLRFAGYTLDAVAGCCVDTSGRVVALTRAELTLLLFLARRLGRVVSRDELTRAVTGRGAERGDRSPGVGYRLAVKPRIATYKAAAVNSATETGTEAAETALRRAHCRARRPSTQKRWRVSPVSRLSF